MPSSKNPKKYDRATLEKFIDQYLDALDKNDPSGLPLAGDVKFVENNQELKIGDGTWKTVTGLGVYRHYFADLLTGQTAVVTVADENGKKVIYNLRLKITSGKISEIEVLIVRDYMGAERLEKRGQPPSLFLETVPEERRMPREKVIATANKYFTGMVRNDPKGDYSFFADRCNRMENGLVTTNAPAAEYGHSTDKEFVTMTCKEQFETGFLGFVTRIRDRRFFIVDEERQATISYALFDHDGTVRQIDMPQGKSFAIPPYFSTPRTLEVCEAFKVEDDQIHFIEVSLTEFPYGTRPGWDTKKDPWLGKLASSKAPKPRKIDGSMTRAPLAAFVDRFLAALLSRDAKPKGLAASVRYTENGQQLNIGDAMWGTVSEISEHKVVLADPAAGTVGFCGCIKELNVEAFLTARLKVQNNEITEIEALVMRHEYNDARMGTMTLMGPRLEAGESFKPGICNDLPGVFGEPVSPDERISAKAMIYIVQEKRGNVRERYTLVTDVEYGLLLEMEFSDVPNANTGPIDSALSGPYSVMRTQLHKISGQKIIKTKLVIMGIPYQMKRGW